jgi:hypothetical protein
MNNAAISVIIGKFYFKIFVPNRAERFSNPITFWVFLWVSKNISRNKIYIFLAVRREASFLRRSLPLTVLDQRKKRSLTTYHGKLMHSQRGSN